MVPIAGLAGRQTVDLNALYNDYTPFLGNDWGGGSRTFNLDGLVVYPGGRQDEGYDAYNHIFRTGAMEGVSLGGGKRQVHGGPERAIVWSLHMSKFFHNSVGTFMQSAKSWGFAGPAVLSVAVLQVEGYELAIGSDSYRRFSQAASDRPHLVLPEVWIENLDTADIDDAVRPLMDMLWQAFGAERCLDFDATTGAFNPRRA